MGICGKPAMPALNERPSIASATPTIAALLGIAPPVISRAEPIASVLKAASRVFDGRHAEKCLVFAPDAFGDHLRAACPAAFETFTCDETLSVALRAALPPKTPVCYATIFTGAPPSVHGITEYKRPILTCETLFDALTVAGRRVAIVAVASSSVDLIFRERAIDYFSEVYDPQVTARAVQLLEEDRHDVIVVYEQAYDDALHRAGPLCEEAFAAARATSAEFAVLKRAFDRCWGRYDRALLIAPDHGAHATPTGGSHGEDIAEDTMLHHFYYLNRGEERRP
jgi:hypothetical protein